MGIVDIFITSEAAVYRLAQQGRDVVLDVAPCPGIVKNGGDPIESSQRLVPITIGEKSGIRCDLSPMKLKPYTAIKPDLQTFTLGVGHFLPPLIDYICCNYNGLG